MNIDSIGMHWYGGTPLSQEWNKKINHENFASFNNTICKLITQIWKG